jgi:TIR domain
MPADKLGPRGEGSVTSDRSEPALAPLFFLSYAHPREPSRLARTTSEQSNLVPEFFTDLSSIVSELVYLPTGVYPGFFDEDIGDGNRWNGELLEAIGTCQVFIALMSESYLRSEWCGMEWYAFSQRTVTLKPGGTAGRNQTCIIPVRWFPIDETKAPEAVSEVQFFSPSSVATSVAREYEKDGLYSLLWTKKTESYRQVVWRLAQRVKELVDSCYVQPKVLDRSQLRNAFEE